MNIKWSISQLPPLGGMGRLCSYFSIDEHYDPTDIATPGIKK